MNPFHEQVGVALTEAFRKLLCEKHLYQYVEPDTIGIIKSAEKVRQTLTRPLPTMRMPSGPMRPPVDQVIAVGMQLFSKTWIPLGAVYTPTPSVNNQGEQYVQFEVPSINTFCSNCEGAWPCNPSENICLGGGPDQWFYFGYQCQQCKGPPIRFLIRREGMKIRLTGRDPIEVLPTPKVLVVAKFYSDATVAHHAGQTLAGIFLLRTFIEQFWRTQAAVKKLTDEKPRATGDEQGAAYQQSLPPEFKDRFPSLSELYGHLSAAMHEAKADAQIFDDTTAKIIKHFKAREVYEL